MALLGFQTSLAQLVRAPEGGDPQRAALTADERNYLSGLAENPAFRFTVKVQRSWCAGRAAKAAYLTLSILPGEKRDALLREWVDGGGGTQSFVGAESAAFLAFIAGRLAEPSHELTICRMELAALRASEGAQCFRRPELSRVDLSGCSLRRGRYSGVVHFYAEPQVVLSTLVKHEPWPEISKHTTALFFGPGLDRLYKRASQIELELYDRLVTPIPSAELRQRGIAPDTIHALLAGGVLEYAE